ncbi:OmpA family protein [Catalinimonas niigatensis]|uniref:OmpA family protein n=1 Tax=Catalinimonas niigatensis TaxID=1397264 RepID=UPI0026661A7D|nr:OmpA family protein [Catalinimonas niigatensis]WPP51348.1 OmpA family protein [Catalinimonas niigatensis]
MVLRDLHFSFDSDALETAYSDDLSKLSHFLTVHPEQNISIQGHSSDEGTDAYNLDLSYKRAQAVGEWLVGEGITPERLRFEAYGSSRPISELSQKANRRVEVILLKE